MLEELNLASNGIGPVGARSLAAALDNSATLTSLHLGSTPSALKACGRSNTNKDIATSKSCDKKTRLPPLLVERWLSCRCLLCFA
jgi:hypothetical protein